jgi:hypothetical protein
VFAARNRIRAVDAWNSTNRTEPLPKTLPATSETVVGMSPTVGSTW